MIKKILIIFFLLGLLISSNGVSIVVQAADCDDKQSQEKVDCLQKKVNELEGQTKTLSSQIAVLDNQVRLTQARIEATKKQIADLTLDIDTATKKIQTLAQSLDALIAVLLNRIVATYESGTVQPFTLLLSSSDVSNFFSRSSYLKIVQAHDKKLVYETQQAKNDYANQKSIFEGKRKKLESLSKQLVAYTIQLDQENQSKKDLLAQTQGSEENYQKLLAAAEAQLAAFSNFAAAHGGASILSDQTVCDDWGCYYNQRDSQWGNLALNNSQFTIASDGCLVTSMAMVYTHYNHKNVTPISINSNSNNFASYYPAFLKYRITADGASSDRVGAIIDSELSSGNPVVVGVSYDRGPIPDHFVVLLSGTSGNYIMNDPFVPNGHKISFSDHYSASGIREIDKVVF